MDVVPVAVLVLVLDVLVLMTGVGMLVHSPVGVLVLVAVWMLMLVVLVVLGAHRSSGFRRPSTVGVRATLRARATRPDQGEVGEASPVTRQLFDAAADRVELPGIQRLHGSAALAEEVFPFATADKQIQARAVAEVNVAHQAVTLEHLEVSIDRSDLDAESAGDPLGGDGSFGAEERFEDESPRRREPEAPLTERPDGFGEAVEGERVDLVSDGHRAPRLSPA